MPVMFHSEGGNVAGRQAAENCVCAGALILHLYPKLSVETFMHFLTELRVD